MYTIGLGGSEHDFSCALCKDGRIIVAIEEERITRKKHGIGIVETLQLGKSVEYCLDYAGITRDDISLVVCNDLLKAAPLFGFKDYQVINHHLSHAASTFFTSGYDESSILVVDAAGSENNGQIETASLYYGQGTDICVVSKVYGTKEKTYGFISNSIGELYTLVTKSIGFNILQEGKTMGLAPYGTVRYIERFRNFINLLPEGKFSITHNALIECKQLMETELARLPDELAFQCRADFAMAVQEVTNEVIHNMAKYLAENCLCTSLCYAGGVALNSVTNGVLEKMNLFYDYYVQPGSGDSGTAIGAALWGYFQKMAGQNERMLNCFLGKLYQENEVSDAVKSLLCKQNFSIETNNSNDMYEHIGYVINTGHPVCVFQGRSEFGPRALGNRSILCATNNVCNRDKVNRIKRREWFRPLAPAVLHEYKKDFFQSNYFDPFMLFVDTVKPEVRDQIPAVVHTDGSARTQSVSIDSNPCLYHIIDEYRKLSGIPLVMNTSYNIGCEPIVETPYDAIKSFISSDVCYLAIGNHIIKKIGVC